MSDTFPLEGRGFWGNSSAQSVAWAAALRGLPLALRLLLGAGACLSLAAVWLISASVWWRLKCLWLGILRWESLKSEVEVKGKKMLQEKKHSRGFWDQFYLGFSQWLEPLCLQEQSQHRKCVTETAQKSLTSWILLLKIHIFTITDKWWCASHRNVLAFANLLTVAPNPPPTPLPSHLPGNSDSLRSPWPPNQSFNSSFPPLHAE